MTNERHEKMFYTIGEVEKITGLRQHVIRSWEKKIPSLAPFRHNGRRLYNKNALDRLQKTKNMVKSGYRVSSVEGAIKKDVGKSSKVFEYAKIQHGIEESIRALSSMYQGIEEMLRHLDSDAQTEQD